MEEDWRSQLVLEETGLDRDRLLFVSMLELVPPTTLPTHPTYLPMLSVLCLVGCTCTLLCWAFSPDPFFCCHALYPHACHTPSAAPGSAPPLCPAMPCPALPTHCLPAHAATPFFFCLLTSHSFLKHIIIFPIQLIMIHLLLIMISIYQTIEERKKKKNQSDPSMIDRASSSGKFQSGFQEKMKKKDGVTKETGKQGNRKEGGRWWWKVRRKYGMLKEEGRWRGKPCSMA